MACLLGSSQSLDSKSDLYGALRNRSPTHSKPGLRYVACVCLQGDSLFGSEQLHVGNTGCGEFAGNEQRLPQTSTSVFSVKPCALEDSLVQHKML